MIRVALCTCDARPLSMVTTMPFWALETISHYYNNVPGGSIFLYIGQDIVQHYWNWTGLERSASTCCYCH